MPNLTTEIVQFANGKTDYYVAFQDYYNHYKALHNEKIGTYTENVSFEEKSEKVTKAFFEEVENRSGVKRDAMNVDAWATHPNVKWAAMAVINANINSVLPMTINPSIGLYTDIRYAGHGDIVKFKISPRTLFTISKGAHGERTTNRQKKYNGDLVMAPQEHIITTYVDMYRVLSGKEDIGEFVRLVVLTIETEMTKDATLALTTGMAAGAYPAALNYTGASDVKRLIQMGETVQAYNFGARPIIAGPSTALAQVVADPSLGYRGNYDADGGRINLLKNFYGFDLLMLPQVATGNYADMGLALDPDTIYVISPALDKLVKGVVTTTLTNSNQFYENADITQNFTMRKDWDFQFASAAFGGVYKITA